MTAVIYTLVLVLAAVFVALRYRSRKQNRETEKRVRDGDV